jgi:hypothetical protein
MAEKRLHVRVVPSSAEPVRVQLVGNDFVEMLKARDISVGGLSVFIPHALQGCNIDNEIQVVVALPAVKPFLLRGIIRHRESGERGFFGIQFTKISDRDRLRLEEYVNKRVAAGATV